MPNYVPGKEGSEDNEADYHSHYSEPLTGPESQVRKNQAEFEQRLLKIEKDITAIVKSSAPEAVTWQELTLNCGT